MAGQQNQDPEERYRNARNIGFGIMIPTMLGASVVVGCVLGYLVDKWLHTEPWGLLIGLVLGCIAGVREMLKLVKKMQQNGKE